MALQVTCAGVTVPVQIDSITFEDKVDDAGTATFTVVDSTGLSLSQYQVVQITDTVTSVLLYAGYIDNVSDTSLGPASLGTRLRVVTCKDNRWTADKLTWVGPEFNGWLAGDVAAELHRVALSAEGVTAAYALRHDSDATSFGAGVLSGTTATGGALTLSASGTNFTQIETSTADFNTGTLSTIGGVNNQLALTSYLAIKYVGSAGANLDNNNLYTYTKVWAGTPYTLVAGDEIYCDVWVDSRSPEIKASIDILFSDGTWMSNDLTFQDQEIIPMAAVTDLKGWADDQWYSRKCIVGTTQAGKVVTAVYLSFQGEKGGDYIAYFKNIKITATGNGTVRVNVFSGGMTNPSANVKASSNGYYNIGATVVTAYAESGVRVSPSRSITSVGIVRGSVISWTEIDTMQLPGAASVVDQQVLVEASYDDGATYQTCTNHQALPGLIVGMNASGRAIILRQTLSIGGTDPTKAPVLADCSFTVFTAPAAVKTDFVDIDNTSTLMGGGTLTNCTNYTNGLMTTGFYRNWDNLDFSSQTLFGVSGAGNPAQGCQENYFFLRTDNALDCRSQFNFAGQYQNFNAEIDIHLVNGVCQYGLIYRTTYWGNANNTFGYFAFISGTQVTLAKGSNSSTGAYTVILSVPLTLTTGAWYRMKVVVNGSSHQIFLNDVLYVNQTDSSYTATGYLGVRFYNGGSARDSAHFDNFGIINYESDLMSVSSRVTASIALSGIVGSSIVNWLASVPSTSTLLVESTIDGGTTWNTCTNGAQVPLLVPGFNAAGKSLKFRFTMTNQAIGLPIAVIGYSSFVIGQYSASGTRVSPALALDNAGTVGSSSVTWVASTPAGTGVAVASSLDDITFTSVAASGNPIAGLLAQGAMTYDDFISNTAANYTAAFWTGGAAPVFSINTALSRMEVTSGTNGIILWNIGLFPTAKDVDVEVITDQCETGGLVWRYTSVDNCYYLNLHDSLGGTNPNTLTLRKRVTATDTQLVAPTTLPVTFTRGTYHTLKVTMVGQVITAYFDGIQVFTFTDASLAGPGQVGLRQSSATTSRWYSVRAQQLGQSAVGATAYTKTTLTSTDPTQNPVMTQLVTSVRGPDLMSGILINGTSYQYKNTVADCLKDVAGQSKYYTRIDKNKHLSMKDRAYSPAPWPLYSADPQLLVSSAYPQAIRQSPLYRNRQYVYNCVNLQTVTELKPGDGNTQSWVLAYPVNSLTSVTMDGDPQTVGVQGVDTGKNFYYKAGTNVLATDASLFPEAGAAISVTYVAEEPYVAMKESTAQQAILAAIDDTSGIVSSSVDGQGISAAAGDALAQANIDAYAFLSVDWEYITARAGLAPGQYQSVFVPEYGLSDLDMLITDIVTTPWMDGNGNVNYEYDVKATSGPNIGSWQKIFA